MSELVLMTPPPTERSPNMGRFGNCPKCNSSHVVNHSENRGTGLANTERNPSFPVGKRYTRYILRCLECNHKWAVYGA